MTARFIARLAQCLIRDGGGLAGGMSASGGLGQQLADRLFSRGFDGSFGLTRATGYGCLKPSRTTIRWPVCRQKGLFMKLLGFGQGNFLRGGGWLWLLCFTWWPGRCMGQSYNYNGLEYLRNGTGIVISGYTGPGGAITIPASIPGLHGGLVTYIGDLAFQACSSLTSVVIPDGVIGIGNEAFYDCPNLTSANIPTNVTSIGEFAFADCTSLTNIILPGGLRWLGQFAFTACNSLSAITVDARNSVYSSRDGVLFDRSHTQLIQYPGGAAGAYTVPDGVITIEPRAFLYTLGLTSVTVPGSVLAIGDNAFMDCEWMTNATLSSSLTSIGQWAFASCWGLNSVTIPGTVTNLGDGAFEGCRGLTNAFFQGDAPSPFGQNVFDGTGPGFSISFPCSASGWSTPAWMGYPAQPYGSLDITTQPLTQTAETGQGVQFSVSATNVPPQTTGYQWYFGGTYALPGATNSCLVLPAAQPGQAGAYMVVVTNTCGVVTSDTALLSVIAPVTRRTVPAIGLPGGSGGLPLLVYADRPTAAASLWSPLTNLALNPAPPWCFDLSLPLPAQRFYRAEWTNGPPGVLAMSLAAEIPLSGPVGSSVRVDYINQFGPTNAWVTLSTMVLTNTTQLYFDLTAFRQPTRLYRLVRSP